MVLVDANVLLDLFTADEVWQEWSRTQLGEALREDGAGVNPIVYAEVSLAFAHARELDEQLEVLGIHRFELPYEAAFPAARAFARYRRQGGRRRSPLPDFYIGAHAEVKSLRLLTRDAARYRTYFPKVDVVAPET